MEMMAIFKDRD